MSLDPAASRPARCPVTSSRSPPALVNPTDQLGRRNVRRLLITLLSLVLLGPDVIFGFSAAITFGIFVGTYSSIFMSTPILIWLGVTGDSFVPRETSVEIQDRKARGEA